MAWRNYLHTTTQGDGGSLTVFAVRDGDDRLTAVFPSTVQTLALGGIRLCRIRRIGMESVLTEATRLLVNPANEETAVAAVQQALAADADVLFWQGLNPTGEALRGLLAQPGAEREPGFSALGVDLPEHWSVLESSLSRKLRKTIRTDYKQLARLAGPVSFHVADTPAAILSAVDTFLALHRQCYVGSTRTGKIDEQAARTFFESLSHVASEATRMMIFQLHAREAVIATRVAFLNGNGLFLHLFADEGVNRKPGALTVLMVEIYKYAIAQRLRFVHISVAKQPSNLRWRPREIDGADVVLWSDTAIGRTLRLLRPWRRRAMTAWADLHRRVDTAR